MQEALSTEGEIECEINDIENKVLEFNDRRRGLQKRLLEASVPRRLLFEKGKPLEEAILHGLRSMGFQASGFNDGESEFDAVFLTPEGRRFIGESEGRDSKAIGIDKFSQLARNLNEDFDRKEVEEMAQGILFGNGFRLLAPVDRIDPFTEKCRKAVKRIGFALVHTPDMFEPARYLKEHPEDEDYAEACRRAIADTVGDMVKFPAPPGQEKSNEE